MTSPGLCSTTERRPPHRLSHPLWQLMRDGTGRLGRLIDGGFDWYARRRQAIRQRRDLAQYDDYMLKDIGLSRADVEQEIRKAFWQY